MSSVCSAVVHRFARCKGCHAEALNARDLYHEWTRMNTKFLETTEYTDYTEKTINASQTSDMVLRSLFWYDMMD